MNWVDFGHHFVFPIACFIIWLIVTAPTTKRNPYECVKRGVCKAYRWVFHKRNSG